ncbi:MAG: DUF354 domain-containing protein, partial [Candidatus Helarchaeota archaeon]
MKILLEISHPARVHFFKNFYWELIKLGNEVIIVAKNKEITIELLDIYKIPYKVIGVNKKGSINKVIQLIKNFIQIVWHAKCLKPDVFIGGASPSLGFTSFLFRKPYISFSDTEHAKMTWLLAKPFMTKILTPKFFLKDFGKKHVRFAGFKELAYLHPRFFKPDPNIYNFLGISSNKRYVFLRFISWSAHHDRGQKGISDKMKIKAVHKFRKIAKVFISAEGVLPKEIEKFRINIPKDKIHHVLYYASLYFGESGTMATESAILGTPTVRVSSLAKMLGNFKELKEKYHLIEYYDSDEEGFK